MDHVVSLTMEAVRENIQDEIRKIEQGFQEAFLIGKFHISTIEANKLLYKFFDNDENHVICYALVNFEIESNSFELEKILIDHKFKHCANEVIRSIIKLAYVTNINRVWICIFRDNSEARNILLNLGFHCDGVLRESYRLKDGFYLDQVVYSLLAHDQSF